MKTQIASGDVVDVVAPFDVVSGDPLKLGSMFGFCEHSASSGDNVALRVTGTYTVDKAASQAWTLGQVIYFDNDEKEFTTSNVSGGIKAGVAIEAAGTNDATGKIRLSAAF